MCRSVEEVVDDVGITNSSLRLSAFPCDVCLANAIDAQCLIPRKLVQQAFER